MKCCCVDEYLRKVGRYIYAMLCYAMLPYLLETHLRDCFRELDRRRRRRRRVRRKGLGKYEVSYITYRRYGCKRGGIL